MSTVEDSTSTMGKLLLVAVISAMGCAEPLQPAVSPAAAAAPPAAASLSPTAAPSTTGAPTIAPAPSAAIERYNQSGAEADIGYTQAVRFGNLLFVSGTVGWGEQGFPATLREQMILAYGHLKRTLDHYGATFADVVQETLYVTDLEALKESLDDRKQLYGGKDYPATSAVQVVRLWEEEVLIEIELIVALPERVPAGDSPSSTIR